MYFFGVQRYDIKDNSRVIPAKITAGMFTINTLLTSGSPEK